LNILYQGFVDPELQQRYVEVLTAYLNEIADPDVHFDYLGVSPADVYVHRLTELRCSVDALRSAIAAAPRYDAVIMGHFQDAGLYEARATLGVPVIGLGEASLLYACTLGHRIGLVTIDPVFIPWHEEQVLRYRLDHRVVGVRAMRTGVADYVAALDDSAVAARIHDQFLEQAATLAADGVEVVIPAGGLPALLLRDEHDFEIDGAVVLNPTAVAAKQAECAVRLRRLNGTRPSRRATFAPPSDLAVSEFLMKAK
jgi:allantoin racemase